MPKLSFDKAELIPEGLRETAANVDGKFVIDVVPQVKLNEFREKNVGLMQELEGLKGKVTAYSSLVGEDVTKASDELRGLRDMAQQVKDGKLTAKGDIDLEVTRRVEATKTQYETQLREAGQKLKVTEETANALQSRLHRSIIDREVTNAVLAEDSGVNPAALADILHRAYGLFHVTGEDKLVAKQGDAVVYGVDGVSSMQPKEWLIKVLEQAPYLGVKNTGGGASGSGNGKGKASFAAMANLSPAERLKRARQSA